MADKRCSDSSETRLFWVWTGGGMEWCHCTFFFFFPLFKSRSHCQRLKSAWPRAHPLLSHGGFYLPISSSCGGLPGRLNGAMFPVSQIFKWKPTMKVRPLRAAGRRRRRRCVLALCSWSQTHRGAGTRQTGLGEGRLGPHLQV